MYLTPYYDLLTGLKKKPRDPRQWTDDDIIGIILPAALPEVLDYQKYTRLASQDRRYASDKDKSLTVLLTLILKQLREFKSKLEKWEKYVLKDKKVVPGLQMYKDDRYANSLYQRKKLCETILTRYSFCTE